LLRQGAIDFAGKYYTARECELRPRGPRPNGPPLLMGTTSPRMLRLCATYCDYWNVWSRNRAAELPEVTALLDAACHDVGRDPAAVQRTVTVHIDLPGFDPPRPLHDLSITPHLSGSLDEIAAELRRYPARGISHIQVVLNPNTVEGIEVFAPVLDLVKRG
jgi:alkanesulfonate monooxygenase SsuD/methylene tetrahydromethanopterin reductase-like flavin-dependent oxidoreductase (luciferase family)